VRAEDKTRPIVTGFGQLWARSKIQRARNRTTWWDVLDIPLAEKEGG